MAELPAIAADDERLAVFATVRDLFRYAVSRFNAADLAYGHGATNAIDEAAFIVLEGLEAADRRARSVPRRPPRSAPSARG